jgi:seryl-tRNA synthetase
MEGAEQFTGSKVEAKPEIKTPKKQNLVVILTSIGTVLFLVLSVWFYVAKEEEHDKRVTTEKKLEQTLVAKRVVEQNLKETTENNAKLTAHAQDLENEVAALQENIAQVTREKEQVVKEAEAKNAKITEISGLLQSEKSEKKALARELESAKAGYKETQRKLASLQDEKEQLEGQLQGARSQGQSTAAQPQPQTAVDLGKVSVGTTVSRMTSPELPGKVGKILVVNDEFNFVVVSFGKNDGLKGGEVLSISREGKAIGKVQVEKLYDAISAATILDGKAGVYSEGDTAKL